MKLLMGAVHLVQRDNLGEGRLEAGEPAFDHELGHQQDLAVALGGVRVETLVKRVHLETERAPLDQSIHRLPARAAATATKRGAIETRVGAHKELQQAASRRPKLSSSLRQLFSSAR